MRLYPNTTVDSEFKTLRDAGYSGSLNDMQFSFLRAQGYRNALADMMTSWLSFSFSPSMLFSTSEPGVWYDPSDLTTLFQDTAGTTPVTAAGQSVALALDKSKGLVLGSELVTNGTFDSATGWTLGTGITISSGTANFNTTSNEFLTQSVAISAGKTYRVTLDVSAWVRGAPFVSLGAGSTVSIVSPSVSGQKSFVVVAGSTDTNLRIGGVFGSGTQVSIDNISVKELPGNHAVQATTANRPIYGVHPFGGRRNLLVRTEEFDNASWTKVGSSVSANTSAAPDGTTTADKVVEDTSTGTHRVSVAYTFTGPQTHTLTCYMKAAERSFGYLLMGTAAFGGDKSAYFDLSNGTVGTTTASTTASIQAVGGGWYRCSITATSISGSLTAGYTINAAQADNVVSYTGTSGSGILVWGAQLETGSTATAYQRVGSAFDVTEAGVASLSYLSFDGVDDFLVTPTITPGVDKAQVFAGVRKLASATAVLVELSVTLNSNNGAVSVLTDVSASAKYQSVSRGTAAVSVDQAANIAVGDAPDTAVLTATHDIATDSSVLRRNGVAGTNSTGDKGAGNFLAYPLYIGRRGGTSLPFNGNLYSLIVRFGANLDAANISSTERWVGGKTGVTIA